MSSLQQYQRRREQARLQRVEDGNNRLVGFVAIAAFIALLAITYIMHIKTVADDKAAANYGVDSTEVSENFTTERGD